MEFYELVKKTRKEQKLTQKQLAEKAGVSASYIGHLEQGGETTLFFADCVCRALNIKFCIGVQDEEKTK